MYISMVCMDHDTEYVTITCQMNHPITTETIETMEGRFDNGCGDVMLRLKDDYTVFISLSYDIPQSVIAMVFDNLRFVDREPADATTANVVGKLYSNAYKFVSHIKEWYD